MEPASDQPPSLRWCVERRPSASTSVNGLRNNRSREQRSQTRAAPSEKKVAVAKLMLDNGPGVRVAPATHTDVACS